MAHAQALRQAGAVNHPIRLGHLTWPTRNARNSFAGAQAAAGGGRGEGGGRVRQKTPYILRVMAESDAPQRWSTRTAAAWLQPCAPAAKRGANCDCAVCTHAATVHGGRPPLLRFWSPSLTLICGFAAELAPQCSCSKPAALTHSRAPHGSAPSDAAAAPRLNHGGQEKQDIYTSAFPQCLDTSWGGGSRRRRCGRPNPTASISAHMEVEGARAPARRRPRRRAPRPLPPAAAPPGARPHAGCWGKAGAGRRAPSPPGPADHKSRGRHTPGGRRDGAARVPRGTAAAAAAGGWCGPAQVLLRLTRAPLFKGPRHRCRELGAPSTRARG